MNGSGLCSDLLQVLKDEHFFVSAGFPTEEGRNFCVRSTRTVALHNGKNKAIEYNKAKKTTHGFDDL